MTVTPALAGLLAMASFGVALLAIPLLLDKGPVDRLQALDRPPVEQQRDGEQRHGERGHREQAGERGRDRHASTLVIRRMSTNATPYKLAEDTSAMMPGSVVVSSRMMPGESALIRTIVPAPIIATR